MPAPVSPKSLQLGYCIKTTSPGSARWVPVNGSFPIPIGPPKRDPRAAPGRWRAVDKVRLPDGSVIEVAIRRVG